MKERISKVVSTTHYTTLFAKQNSYFYLVIHFTTILWGAEKKYHLGKKTKDSLSTSHPEACQHSLIPRLI